MGCLPSFLPCQSLIRHAGAKQSRGGKLGSAHNNTTESGLAVDNCSFPNSHGYSTHGQRASYLTNFAIARAAILREIYAWEIFLEVQ